MQDLAALARAAEEIEILLDKVPSTSRSIVVSEFLPLVQGALKG